MLGDVMVSDIIFL